MLAYPLRFAEHSPVTNKDELLHMKRLLSVSSCFALLMCAVLPATAETAEKPKKVKYVAPEGFAGHKWGDLRSSFDRLPVEPIGVGAAWMRALQRTQDYACVPIGSPGPTMSGAVEGCDFQATLLRLRQSFEGGGVYVLSEYAIEGPGLPLRQTRPTASCCTQ